jgi:pyruvate,orthophosphate dikinase
MPDHIDRQHPATIETALEVSPLAADAALAERLGEAFAAEDECFALRRNGVPLALVRLNQPEGTLRSAPAADASPDGGGDYLAYAAAVVEYAASQVAATGRLLNLRDPQPHRLLDPIADQLATRPTREQPIVQGRFALGGLVGTISHLGAAEGFKPSTYQVELTEPIGRPLLISFPAAESVFHQRRLRVAPRATVAIVGLDETTTELAGYLRSAGLNVIAAEQPGMARRDRLGELTERGFPVQNAADPAALASFLDDNGPVKLILEGYASDTVLNPEERPEIEARAAEQANRVTVLALQARFGCPVLFKAQTADARLYDAAATRLLQPESYEHPGVEALAEASGLAPAKASTPGDHAAYFVATPVESAILAAILPALAPNTQHPTPNTLAGAELTIDLLLPTAVPYGARNRHSPDDVAVKVARGMERRLLALLAQLDPNLPEHICAVDDPDLRQQRPRALAVHQRFGPWNVHTVVEIEVRATGPDGAPLRAATYKASLAQHGAIRLIDFDDLGLDRDELLALDGTELQNVAFQKLGKIHHFRPTGVVVPLSDRAFKVILLVPQISGGYLNRLEAALALSGVAGTNAERIARLAEAALDLPRIDARVGDTFPVRGIGVDRHRAGGGRPHPHPLPGGEGTPLPQRGDSLSPWERVRASSPGAALVSGVGGEGVLLATTAPDGHSITTRPSPNLDWAAPDQRLAYYHAVLDLIRRHASENHAIVEVFDEKQRDLKRFLANAEYTGEPAASGIARASFALGNLTGTRWRLGSDRVPEADRLLQVDVFRRDDPSDTPSSVTITFGVDDDAPLVAMPTTVQLVCGFGNIAGDVGVLERRLGYRVVAWNRSPNERARHALENGIPLYEFDETIGSDGARVIQTKQRGEYARAGLPLAGLVRDLIDNGLVIGHTDRGTPVKARVRHVLDGLFGSSRHPATGKSTKNSEIYRDLLFKELEARGIPTIYNGYNTPEKVAGSRIFVHDAFRTSGVDPNRHYGEAGDQRKSIMCVSCNTTNITSVLLRLIAIPGLSDVAVRVLTNRKTCDPFVGEGKQTVNYQGMAFDFNYHHWEDSKLFFDAVQDDAIRERLGALFAREVKAPGEAPEWAISTHATGQAGTEFHVGLVQVRGKLNGGPLDASALKAAIATSGIENVALIDFPGDRINSTQFLATLHQRIGLRNLYVQPCMVVQDASDVIVVFFTPHLYNVKPNNLVAALNRDGLVANTVAGLNAATTIVASALGLGRQRAALRRYYPVRAVPLSPSPSPPTGGGGAQPPPPGGGGGGGAGASPIYFFGPGIAEGMALPSAEERRQLLGGKGAGLAEMATIAFDDPLTGQRAPIPVPPGYTITTAQARRYFDGGKQLPADLVAAVDAAQARLEAMTGKRLGDPNRPLLVSVRSGAAVSMPGMMDTILNLGLNDQVAEALAAQTGDAAFAWDSYQRFVEMYGEVVLGVDRARYLRPLRERILAGQGLNADAPLDADLARRLVAGYKATIREATGRAFPDDPREQLFAAITAVFDSSYSERAVTYRHIHGIAPTVISAVNVVAMIFGNLGDDSATGVVFTRDPLTGERALNGEYLCRAQGEDVVRGVRTGQKLDELAQSPIRALGDCHQRLVAICGALERHFRDALDLEFTIERGNLWLLQTRRLGGRSGRAALRIATDLVDEGLIDEREAVVLYGDPKGLSELLAPIFDPRAEAAAQGEGRLLTRGIAASAGAASGRLVVSSERAEELSHRGERVILVRPETSPEDVGGLHSAQGVLTARGGIVSHAAIVARGIGKPAVVGASEVSVDEAGRTVSFGSHVVPEGEIISVNGTTGTVYLGALPVVNSPIKQKVGGRALDPEGEDLYARFIRLLGWASAAKAMEIRANAETPKDLAVALALGAEGIGLARTEHAVLEPAARRIAFSALILATSHAEAAKALAVLEPPMEEEVYQIFKLLQGKPATIRLYDPVPNEFLPRSNEEVGRIADFLGIPADELRARSAARAETNPMLGHRGVRLFVVEPAIAEMQVRATLRAAARAQAEGTPVQPEIQIPLVINRTEINLVADTIRRAANATFADLGRAVPYKIGVMVETPAAVRTADEFAPDISFFSLGVNDLSQTVLAVSRDDTARFIGAYESLGILGGDPFRSIDRIVGSFIAESVDRAKKVNPSIWIFSAGDVGGDPPSVNLFHDIGLDGVSAGPWLVPLGILSAAQANIRRPRLG